MRPSFLWRPVPRGCLHLTRQAPRGRLAFVRACFAQMQVGSEIGRMQSNAGRRPDGEAGARIAHTKKSARAGEHRADGKSLRGVNSKGGGNFAPRLCRHERARRIGHPEPEVAHNIWTQTLGCQGIVGDGWAPRRNKVCRIAIECKRGKSRLVCAPIRFFEMSGERLLHLHSPIDLPLRQTGLGRRRTSGACPSLGCRFDRREACTRMRCTMCCRSR